MSTPRPVAIRVTDLKKSYGALTVLDDVSLEVREGEVTAIIGPSGAGKSTLLRSINLLEEPDSGEIEVLGSVVRAADRIGPKSLNELRRKVGMVFQSFNLFPHLTVLRNVTLAQELVLGRDKKQADDRARELLKRVGLEDKADQYPSRCSGGQQQRIAIARALALDPRAMLFDEPTSALDPELANEVLLVMRKLADEGMTMVVVTHEMRFAREVSETVVVMADGRIIEQGKPSQVFTEPTHERTRKFLSVVLDR
ncbi:MAG TPA: amino acid ABC transporter ATP-binding protein [Actinokineospora sp.]|nr:amino acid ABC transporter ATP-binding protein [Actinokineospora sp.]